jgi:hypothetical protein
MLDIKMTGTASIPRRILGVSHPNSAIIEIEDNLVIIENLDMFPDIYDMQEGTVTAKVNPCSFMIFDGQYKVEIVFSLESITSN